MKLLHMGLPLLCAACMTTAALADDQPSGDQKMSGDMSMMSMKPGPEAQALAKFFVGNATWNGEVAAGAMGPNSPAMKSKGSAMCKEVLGGYWYTCDVQDVMGTGKDAMTWKGHMIVGWDAASKTYKGFSVDNMGVASTWTGTMDGDNKFSLVTDAPMMMMGQSFKDRLTWDIQPDGTAKFTDEHQDANGGDWTMWESATAKMTGGVKMKGKMAAK